MAQAVLPAAAQTSVLRIKAKLVAVNGAVIVLQPLSGDPNAKPAEARRVTLLPDTRYVQSGPGSFATIKVGDYVGVAMDDPRDDAALRANSAYLYAEPLRGTGEGRFTERGRLLINGTVSKVDPASGGGTLTLHYRGATLNQSGKGGPVCEGRAVPAAFASALACTGDAVVRVSTDTAISALTVGDKSILTPGATVTATLTQAGGREVTPGLIVEAPAPVEKPHAAP